MRLARSELRNTFSVVAASNETIIVRAPTRIDFGGGWTDVPPYSDEMGGFVCNVAITRYATVTLSPDASDASRTTAPDRAIIDAAARRFGIPNSRINARSDFPMSAGLGGSSATGVAAVAALAAARRDEMTFTQMAELSRDIEIEDVGIAGGRQDHYAAAYGGALGLRFSADGVNVRQIPLSSEFSQSVERRCTIVYTGQSRVSGDTISAVLGAYDKREANVVRCLERMRAVAESMADALAAEDLDALAELTREQWSHQRALHPAITTPLIDEIVESTAAVGAAGAKALGASGGGCVLVIAREDSAAAVRAAVASLGEVLPFRIAPSGVERCA
jgi:D-glycero-alpha-D-manno-heptose-7-phosphate kinase